MKTDSSSDEQEKSSYLHLNIAIHAAWIQQWADEKELTVPLRDQYVLHHFRFSLHRDSLSILASLVDKPGSEIRIKAMPRWDAQFQRIILDELQLETKSKNVWIKSAGWLATAFFQEKIDARLEERINELYQNYYTRLMAEPLHIPVGKHGSFKMEVQSMLVEKVEFLEGKILSEILCSGIIGVDLGQR